MAEPFFVIHVNKDCISQSFSLNDVLKYKITRDMRRLTTAIGTEKCVVRRCRRCANVIQCTYTNPDSTV